MIAEPSAGGVTRIEEDVERLLRRLAAAARRVRLGSDGEAIHDVRVAARRLTAALDVWRALLKRRARRRALRTLRRLRRGLGPVREAEVDEAALSQRLENLPPEARGAATLLLARLRRRIERGRQNAAERCSEGRIARIRRRMVRALQRRRPTTTELLPARAAALEARAARVRSAVGAAVDDPRDATLHQARLATKRLRYTLERIAAAGPPFDAIAERGRIEPLVAVQEALGRVRDLALLRDRVLRFARKLAAAGHGVPAASLAPLIERLESERREALALFVSGGAALESVGAGPARLGLAGGQPRRDPGRG